MTTIIRMALCLLLVGSVACRSSTPTRYTCPMHPQIQRDAPGSCPICGMDLVPIKAPQAHAGHGGDGAPQGIQIDPVLAQRIGITTEVVAERSLTRAILSYGKVAHDPALWVAQHEYLEALKLGDRSLIRSSELKLQFLGLSAEWIALLRKERSSDLGLHLPSHTGTAYYEAFIPQGDAELVQLGQAVEILDEQARPLQDGVVAAIGTIVDADTRLLRILVKAQTGGARKSNTFTQFRIHIPLGTRVSVPSAAILFNGDHRLVYVVAADGSYVPRRIALGAEAEGYYAIEQGLQAGDRVVTNGHFLIDSETQIRTGGSTGAHQHE